MVKIIADTIEELSMAKSIFDEGVINSHDNKATIDITYSLSNGHRILTNKYMDIVGEIIVGEDGKEYNRFINKD